MRVEKVILSYKEQQIIMHGMQYALSPEPAWYGLGLEHSREQEIRQLIDFLLKEKENFLNRLGYEQLVNINVCLSIYMNKIYYSEKNYSSNDVQNIINFIACMVDGRHNHG